MITLKDCKEFTAGVWLVEPVDDLAEVSVETDSRKDCSNSIFVAFEGERFDAHNFLEEVILQGVKAICVHKKPNLDLLQKAVDKKVAVLNVDNTIKAYQDLATGKLGKSKCKVIGITGSSGKTSAKAILMQMLEEVALGKVLSTIANTNNHIGVPQNVLRLEETHEYAVIEMGTNNPGEIATLARCASPDIAVITSIGDSHSGNFPKNGILYEKSDIVKYMKEDGVAVIPVDLKSDILSTRALEGKTHITFGGQGADTEVEYVNGHLQNSEMIIEGELVQCSLTGSHQAQNVAACVSVMKHLGFSLYEYKSCFEKLELPGMRMKVFEENGVTWVNDAYNANPQSMLGFMEWLRNIPGIVKNYKNRFLVLGDMLELGDNSLSFHQQVIDNLPENWKVVGVGSYFCDAAKGTFPTFETSEAASEFLKNKILAEDLVALKGSRGIKLEKICNQFRN